MKTVLCIGGLDPAGRAGLLADAGAVSAAGARPLCVATALTFQSSRKVDGYEAVSAATLWRQIEVLLRDETIDAVKIGQLATAENAAVVQRLPLGLPLVLDTPLVSSSGAALFPPDQLRAYRPLMERAALVTPNAVEVLALGGGTDPMVAARTLPAQAVLLKGGHLEGANVEDTLLRGAEVARFSSPRLAGRFRGTGCRLASAIAARLVLGEGLVAAVEQSHRWLHGELVREASA
jgi:hydroxymethylpyrimidine/phosphomethylpyrimidine kinase